MYRIIVCSLATVIFLLPQVAQSSSLEKANMFRSHGLKDDAKKELINIIFSDSASTIKAQAHYQLGTIAFEENNIRVALETWTQLVNDYPNSPEASSVQDKIAELAEITGESKIRTVKNAIAQSHLHHGDFWSKGKSSFQTIDSSWIPNLEAAIFWYDKVIAKFPKTEAAELAYEKKFRAIMGWKKPGRYGGSYGIKSDANKWIPKAIETFEAYEMDFPKATYSQAFRYQIAQAYWQNENWAQTRSWLNKILAAAQGRTSFYTDLVNRRMKKLEY